jgi:hypothetical protein
MKSAIRHFRMKLTFFKYSKIADTRYTKTQHIYHAWQIRQTSLTISANWGPLINTEFSK